MFKYSYKFKLHPSKDGIMYLSPTKATLLKAFAPSIVISAASLLVLVYLNRVEEDELENMFKFDENED